MGSSSWDKEESKKGRNWGTVKVMLGLGFWVQGLRCFPWLVVNFFLKDGLKVEPSTLQLLQHSASLPMVSKPIYGLLSDSFYIAGQHRIPYIALGAFLQAVSWIAIASVSPSTMSFFTITLYLLLSNLGASVAEVANDAIVAEAGKQLSASSKSSPSSSSGELQSFVWIASAVGGVLGNLLGGVAIGRFSPQAMFLLFGIILATQFLITISIHESSLNLPKSPSNASIKKQLSELLHALQKPEIARAITWFAASYAVIPALTGTMFFYQTQDLGIGSSVLGISKVFGQAMMLVWGILYNRNLKSVPPKKLLSGIQLLMAGLMVSDAMFVNGIYRKMGMPDWLYVVVFSGFLEVVYFFKILPFNVLIAQLCPPGCEGSLMAFLASVVAFSFIASGYFGVAVASYVGVTGNDFSGLPRALLLQAVCTLLPVYWSSLVPDLPEKARKKES
ncbi:probable folate-biopterin transporter 7 [Diospyros lotus]|uniref:probable folate-biopterin transporter 7 n=1 Tax=Diospyros lotus TaxID=55363 RepID=UPI00224FAF4F|nr:probable folate-biopterin transporter 7 [Diospyros lotus]